jgi:hypothetical protein
MAEQKDTPTPNDLPDPDANIHLVASHTHYLTLKIATEI